jgi:hypothetical protein
VPASPALRGQFRLDKDRIAKEVAVVTAIVNWAIAVLEFEASQGKSYAPAPKTGAPINDMVARYLDTERNQKALMDYSQNKGHLDTLKRSRDAMARATDLMRGLGQLYLRLHKATVLIDDQLDLFAKMGLPILSVLPAILSSIRSMPVKQ